MADEKIVISAIARVVDLASAPLKAIQAAIGGVASVAEKTTSAVASVGAKVGGAMKGFAGRLGEATSKVGNFVRNVGSMVGPLGGLIGLAGLGGAAAAMREFVNEGDALYKMATRLGTTVETIQLFRIAADNVGLADDALANLQKTMAKVARGGKEAEPIVALLKKMGVTAQEMKLGDLEAILPKIMEGFKQNENQVLKTNAALLLFGKSGQAQLEWLSKGAEAAKAAREQMERLGYISTAGAKAANAAADQMTALGFAIKGVRNVVGEALIPAFLPMIKWLTDFIANNRELLKQVALPAFIGALAAAVIGLGIAVASALGPWGLLAAAIIAAGTAIYQHWDEIIKWLDVEMPGLTKTVGEAASAIGKFAADTVRKINEGFQTGGLVGGITAYVTAFKDAYVGIVGWIIDLFLGIDWAAVGTQAGHLMVGALMALWRANLALGQFIIDQFTNALAWMRTADWGSIGQDAGRLLGEGIMLTLKAILNFHLLAAQAGAALAEGIASVDWLKVIQKISTFFVQLTVDMVRIGAELIGGLIKGMWNAIPGLSAVSDAVTGAFKGVGEFFKKGSVPLGDGAGVTTGPAWGRAAANTDQRPSLLRQQAATGNGNGGHSKVEVTSKVIAAPGSTVETTVSQSGAPINVDKVGGSDFATVPQ